MAFDHSNATGRKKILPTELGKDVRTPTGKKIGTVSEVGARGEFEVSLTPDGSAYLDEEADASSEGSSSSFRPEDIEMVTSEAVWLRL